MTFSRRVSLLPCLMTIALLFGVLAPATAATRIDGSSRVTTAIEVSQRFFDRADTVIVARDDSFADALAGAPLAGVRGAPLLFVESDRVARAVKNEIARLGAKNVIVLGGSSAVSDAVVRELGATRIAGANRWETAAKVSDAVVGPARDVERVYLVTGRNFPDAIAVAGMAAVIQAPILLTDTTELPPETVQAIKKLKPALVTLVGGDAVITESVARQVRALGPKTYRLAGQTRYETSAAVVRAGVYDHGMSSEHRIVVSGEDFTDALAAAPASARTNRVLALAPRLEIGPAPLSAVEKCDVRSVTIVGGTRALSETVEERLDAAVAGDCSGDPPPGSSWRSQVAARRATTLLAEHRRSIGVSVPPRSNTLDRIAWEWSGTMASDDNLRHNPNLGAQVRDYRAIAENVGVFTTSNDWITDDDLAPAIEKLHRDFLASSSHRRNMEDPRWDDIGVGVVVRGNSLWMTVIFRQK